MKPKILIYDIETSYLEVKTFGIYDQYLAPDRIKKDWHLLSFAAKWYGEKGVTYYDQSKARDVSNDKALAMRLWKMLDQADIVLTQNGKSFDQKKAYARFAHHGMRPPSPSKHIDTKVIAKKALGFTSNSLEYLCKILGVTQKSKHKKFPGMDLWDECIAGNPVAWAEMKKYNIQDVVSTEAVYNKLRAWDNSVSVADIGSGCRSCGGHNLTAQGFQVTAAGKQQRYQCQDCGAWMKSGVNLLSKGQKEGIKRRC